MRLIHTSSYEFSEFYDTTDVDYAILSHVWREQEILYHDFLQGKNKNWQGRIKLKSFCKQARTDGYEWVWIDTACIDKTSSAELSEAINSMYSWYANADICYVYLDDVREIDDIKNSRWITRGWTLQELIAPRDVVFFNSKWHMLGQRSSLASQLSKWTGIEQVILQGAKVLSEISLATRMSWAAERRTTRLEDRAYCLLGIFDINMPLLYGEGTRAFSRLQEQILKGSHDHSLIAFEHRDNYRHADNDLSPIPVLARDPSHFRAMKIFSDFPSQGALEMTKSGLKIGLKVIPRKSPVEGSYWGVLNCRYEGDLRGQIAIPIMEGNDRDDTIWRMSGHNNKVLEPDLIASAEYREIIINNSEYSSSAKQLARSICVVRLRPNCGFKVSFSPSQESQPHGIWNGATLTSEILHDHRSRLLRTFIFQNDEHDIVFLLRFIDIAMTSKLRIVRHSEFGAAQAYLDISIKPMGDEYHLWLKNELLKGSDFSGLRLRSQVERSVYQRWDPLEVRQFRSEFETLRNDVHHRLSVCIYPAASKMSDTAIWTLEIDHEQLPLTPPPYDAENSKSDDIVGPLDKLVIQ